SHRAPLSFPTRRSSDLHALAHLHTTTRHPRFGWHRDNWLGRRRQVNTWTDDGFEFFARHRLLRWLHEPRVRETLDAADRAALERSEEHTSELQSRENLV